jgi:hypothetical protein
MAKFRSVAVSSQPDPDLHDRVVPAWDAMIHPSLAAP